MGDYTEDALEGARAMWVSTLLAAVFPFADAEYRIGATTKDKTRGMLVYYIDARAVMNRLDEYCHETGGLWWDSYSPLPDGKHVECRLTLVMPRAGATVPVTRCDVGEPAEGLGDGMKGAYSDGLKRAAVKFGIGRYLYELGEVWVELDDRGKVSDKGRQQAERHYRDKTGGAGEIAMRPPVPLKVVHPQEDPGPMAKPAQPKTNGNGADFSKFWGDLRTAGVKPEDARARAQAMFQKPVPNLDADQLQALFADLRAQAD